MIIDTLSMIQHGDPPLHLETTVMATTVKRMIAPTTRHDREVATAVTFPAIR